MSLKTQYTELEQERSEFLERAYRSAILTVPAILPRPGQLRHHLPQNFQSIGARGVNNISSKLGLTLFPPTMPFIRLEVSPADLARYAAEAGPQAEAVEAEITASLHRIEQQAVSRFDTSGWRPAVSEALRQLVVTGNVVLYDRPGGRVASYDMRRFVVERDSEGQLLLVILRQFISPQAARQQLNGVLPYDQIEALAVPAGFGGDAEGIEFFTGAIRQPNGKFTFMEQVGEITIEPSIQEDMEEADVPLIPLRFAAEYGSSYGRGYVEDYDGDLLSLEGISRALTEGAQAIARIIWLVKPGGMTKPDVLSRTPNGGIRMGNIEDIGAVQADKSADLSIAYQIQQSLQVRLGNNFLLNSSVQRNGDRVTAEEIRYVSQELEDALGGVYAGLADTIQYPIASYFFRKMQADGDVERLPDDVEFVIATGLESISRNHKAIKIETFLRSLGSFIPPEEMVTILNTRSLAADLATAFNLDADTYLKSAEEVAQARQEAQMAQAGQALGPEMIKQMGAAQQQQ